MKKWIKYSIIFLVSILFSIGCYVTLLIFAYKEDTEINLATNHKDHLVIPVEIAGKTYPFLWDTGMGISTIDYKLARELGYEGAIFVYDSIIGVKAIGIDSLAFDSLSISIGDINMKAIFRLDGYKSYFPSRSGYDSTKFVGIIGQNIISKYHWLFDFKKNKVKVNNYGYTPGETDDETLKLRYIRQATGNRIINLCINDRDTFPFIFDTGYEGKMNIPFLGKQHEMRPAFVFSDSLSYHLRQDVGQIIMRDTVVALILDSLKINGRTINPLITAGNFDHYDRSESYITVNFVFRFRQMYYNPREKEISFYVSPKDSDFVYQAKTEKMMLDTIKSTISKRNN